MYVVVRRYSGASKLIEAMVERQGEVKDLISSVPGFRAYYAVNTGGGGVATGAVAGAVATGAGASADLGPQAASSVQAATAIRSCFTGNPS